MLHHIGCKNDFASNAVGVCKVFHVFVYLILYFVWQFNAFLFVIELEKQNKWRSGDRMGIMGCSETEVPRRAPIGFFLMDHFHRKGLECGAVCLKSCSLKSVRKFIPHLYEKITYFWCK
jgi:hypothetical protein